MPTRLLLYGFAVWAAATFALRIAGQKILIPGHTARTLILFAVSFPLMVWIIRFLCGQLKLPRERWPIAAYWVLLPTLLFDPFSSAFFPVVFPNMSPDVAGVFGGWMLWCCAGSFTGAALRR